MIEFILISVVTIISSLLSLVVGLSHTIKSGVRFSLVATIISLVTWQLTIYAADNVAFGGSAVVVNNLVFLWPVVAVASFYIFIRLIRDASKKLHPNLQKLGSISMIIGVVMQLVAVASGSIIEGIVPAGSSIEFIRGWGYVVYIIGLLISLSVVMITLFIEYALSRKKSKERQALKIVLITVAVAVAYGLLINVITPLLFHTQDFIGAGVLVVMIISIGLGIAILRGKLLDIRLYAVRSVAYLLTLTTLGLVYYLLVMIVSNSILVDTSQPVSVVLALILALVFQPLKRLFDRFTNRVFYRNRYDRNTFFTGLSGLLVSKADLRQLLERASQYIASTLKSEQVFFVALHGDDQMITAGTKGHKRIPRADVRLLEESYDSSRALTVKYTDDVALQRMLISHRIAIVLPLIKDGVVSGYLFLGDSKSGGYAFRDIQVLETVSNELVIAIQNAMSIQEIKQLNETLQQRIENATSELRLSNSQLKRLDEAKNEFISMASHQLRTPLTSIKGYIDMILEGDAGEITDMQRKFLGEAFVSSERMVRLINDFLNVSRLQTGKFTIEKLPIDLAEVVRQEVDGLKNIAAQRSLKITYDGPKKLADIEIDEGKIRQVIMNFIDNAIYYSKEDTSIKVSIEESKGCVEFKVTDTGIGVPIDEQSGLFQKFFRASNARKQRPDGTGVGLFLAKKVIAAHGGEIIFESEEGKGSTFGFSLPIAD